MCSDGAFQSWRQFANTLLKSLESKARVNPDSSRAGAFAALHGQDDNSFPPRTVARWICCESQRYVTIASRNVFQNTLSNVQGPAADRNSPAALLFSLRIDRGLGDEIELLDLEHPVQTNGAPPLRRCTPCPARCRGWRARRCIRPSSRPAAPGKRYRTAGTGLRVRCLACKALGHNLLDGDVQLPSRGP